MRLGVAGMPRRRAARARRRRRSTDGVVVAVGLEGGGRGVALPGFVDLQVNGFAGIDFLGADADGYRERRRRAARDRGDRVPADVHHVERGRPRHRAALGAAEAPRVARACSVLTSRARSSRRRGSARIPPAIAATPTWLCSSGSSPPGPVRMMTLAPELPGALELVDALHARGIVVSLGHSNATAAEAHAAFDRGVRTVTHVFNAMRPLTHRDPGIVGAALVRPDVVVQAIVDGVHLDPDVVRLLWSVAAGRFALVTDAIAAVGLGDGDYALGSVDLEVNDGIARRSDGVLAGSTLTMIQALRNLVELGVPLERAAEAASLVPAGVLGLGDLGRLGSAAGPTSWCSTTTSRSNVSSSAGETRVAG